MAELENLSVKVVSDHDDSSEKQRKFSAMSDRDYSRLEHIEQGKDRGVWPNKKEFFFAIIGYTVGIGSIWRFPIICSRNGGGAFLIPFFFFLIVSGGPLYYMEVCLGQFTGESAGLAFAYCPLLKGIGILQVILSLVVVWYIINIMTWALYFLYSSCQSTLPWTSCGNHWNSRNCREISEFWLKPNGSKWVKETNIIYYSTETNTSHSIGVFQNVSANETEDTFSSSSYEFWEYKVIGRSEGLEDMGHVQLHLAICLFLSWFLCVAAVIKGVHTLGKVVYVTATAPFIFLTIMFIKGLTMDGAVDGVITFLTPDFPKLLTVQVWLEAAVQVFSSLGPAWGGVITMASYNKFHQKSFWSSTMCVACAGLTSFYNGMVVFALLGFMAKATGQTIQEVAQQSGPGLTFVAFPTVLSHMPLPHFWSILFFLMLLSVVFDSLFGMFETVTSGIIDMFPRQLVKKRVLVNIITGLCFFITGLPVTTNGGIYIIQLGDWYFSQFALLFGAFLECFSICWIYGTDRFAADINLMTGRDVSVPLRVMWTIVTPIFVLISFLLLLAQYSAPAYGDGYVYSDGAIAAGIAIGMMPIVIMIIIGIYTVAKMKGSIWQRLKRSLQPSSDWSPNDKEALSTYRHKPYIYPGSLLKRFLINIRGS